MVPGDWEGGGLPGCELRKAAGAGEQRGKGAQGVGKRAKRRESDGLWGEKRKRVSWRWPW